MNVDDSNKLFKLAFDFVNDTNSTLYLTGKAGTGKTTFLKYVKTHCTKNMVVVAPTGVAAINAGGVTAHSFFQLPFGPYIPNAQGSGKGFGQIENIVDRNTLLSKIRVNTSKKKLMEELELLIIDEVSMLRSDMLDAIDTILRYVRKKNHAFGGVQVLFIGDLYQLPPVVVDSEKEILDQHYQSPFFFHASVFGNTRPIFIELKKIYRQSEQNFIDLLNKLRHNNLEASDFEKLNALYNPNFSATKNNYITLTSHNYKADAINREELNALKSTAYDFKGEIIGDFGDKQLPTDLLLTLKEGAQVMFVKNDSSNEKLYYNGKLATVVKLTNEEIFVKFLDSDNMFEVTKETWDNIGYKLNEETKEIEEKINGQFIQFPLRLAWAITIHKSQGLTFERAVIDAGDSFAPGQVYVALSRCTSMQGLVLHSRILPNSVQSDYRIYDFNLNEEHESALEEKLVLNKLDYQIDRLLKLFDWNKMLQVAYQLEELTLLSKTIPEEATALALAKEFIVKIKLQKEIADKFILEFKTLQQSVFFSQDTTQLLDRTKKAIGYFAKCIHYDLLVPLHAFLEKIMNAPRIKKYQQTLQDVDQIWWHQLHQMQTAMYDGSPIMKEGVLYERLKTEIPIVPKQRVERGDSAKQTLAFYMGGKSIEDISSIRNLAKSTIESHLFEFVKSGELEISRFLNLEELNTIQEARLANKEATTNELKVILNDAFSYHQLRMAFYYWQKETGEVEAST